jgi:SnoaL-like protein
MAVRVAEQENLADNAVDRRLELLLDEREIKNCVLRYCHGTDRLDWAMVASCYLPQASDDHGSFQGGPEEFAAWLAEKAKYRGAKQHYVANQLVEITGDDAVCESYYCCYIEFVDDPEFVSSGGAEAVLMGGRYVDRLSRVDGEWKIASRISLVDWSRSLGEPAHWDSPAAAKFTRGRAGEQDPANVAFAELRGRGDSIRG